MTTMTTQNSGARPVASVKMGNPSLVFGRCIFEGRLSRRPPIPQAGESKLPGLFAVARHSGLRSGLASVRARRTPAAS